MVAPHIFSKGVARYLLDEPWSLDNASRQVTERLTQTDLNGEAHALALVIEHDGIPIGSVLLWLVGADHRKQYVVMPCTSFGWYC